MVSTAGNTHMGLFKMSLEKQITAAKAARDKLIARLADAEVAITERRTAAEQLALDGATDDELTLCEDKLRAAQDRRVTLKAALIKGEAEVSRLEMERDQAADRKQREATSIEVEQLARAISSDYARLVAAAATATDHTARASAVVPESGGALNLFQIIATQLPDAATLIGRLLRAHGEAVRDGRAAAAMPVQVAVEQQVFNLDHPPPVHAEPEKRLGPPIMASVPPTQFERVDRGTGFTLPIPTLKAV